MARDSSVARLLALTILAGAAALPPLTLPDADGVRPSARR